MTPLEPPAGNEAAAPPGGGRKRRSEAEMLVADSPGAGVGGVGDVGATAVLSPHGGKRRKMDAHAAAGGKGAMEAGGSDSPDLAVGAPLTRGGGQQGVAAGGEGAKAVSDSDSPDLFGAPLTRPVGQQGVAAPAAAAMPAWMAAGAHGWAGCVHVALCIQPGRPISCPAGACCLTGWLTATTLCPNTPASQARPACAQ